MAAEKEYRRLPGRGRKSSFFSYGRSMMRLYLGRDHLLSVESTGWTENYRRFYLGDIQSITVSKTRGAFVANIALGILTVISAFVAVLVAETAKPAATTGEIVLSAGPAAFFLVLLIVNVLRGPSCKVHIQTAVSREHLPSLHRLRTATRALAIVRAAIQGVQGALDPEQVPERLMSATGSMPAGSGFGRPVTGGQNVSSKAGGYTGGMHRVTFVLALLAGSCALLDVFLNQLPIVLVSVVAVSAMSVCMVMALVRQHTSNTTAALRGVTWACVGFASVHFIWLYVLIMIASVRYPKDARNEWMMFKKAVADGGIHMAFDLFIAGSCILLGTIGLVCTLRAYGARTGTEEDT